VAEADTTVTEATPTTETPSEAPPASVDTSAESTILGGDPAPKGGDPADEAEGTKPQEPAADTPEVPEAYELTAPEGFALDAKLIEDVTPIFKEAGLSNEAANKLMPAAVKFAESLKASGERQMLDSITEQRAQWAREAKADPEIGGAKWDETVSMSAKALDALGEAGQPLKALLNDSGLGNHPAMIRAMSFFGRAIGEDTAIPSDGAGKDATPTAHKLYPNDVPKGG
jgi:hypothetical protein